MKLFDHSPHFGPIDPLGDGLREEIKAEQSEPEAMTLELSEDAAVLAEQWNQIVDDLHHDPTWFNFAEEE